MHNIKSPTNETQSLEASRLFTASHIISINPILKESPELKAQYFSYLKKLLQLIPYKEESNTEYQLSLYKNALCHEYELETYSDVHLKKSIFCYLLPFDLFKILDSQMGVLTYERLQSVIQQIITDHYLPKDSYALLEQEFLAACGDSTTWDQILSLPQLSLFKEYLRYIRYAFQFAKKTPYTLLVTATMSAGKSTLINAIVGMAICMAENVACTSNIHSIISKPFKDGIISRYTPREINADATPTSLWDCFQTALSSKSSKSWAYFNGILGSQRIVLLDSPGVNSYENPQHREITQNIIHSNEYDLLVYVLNATNLSSIDEQRHLEFTAKNRSNVPIIFILNKVDKLISDDDSPEHVIEQQIKFLDSMGFKNAVLLPVSAKAAYLAKKSQLQKLNRIDQRELDLFTDKFQHYSLSPYYKILMEHLGIPFHDCGTATLLEDCGFRYLEEIIKYFMEEK